MEYSTGQVVGAEKEASRQILWEVIMVARRVILREIMIASGLIRKGAKPDGIL